MGKNTARLTPCDLDENAVRLTPCNFGGKYGKANPVWFWWKYGKDYLVILGKNTARLAGASYDFAWKLRQGLPPCDFDEKTAWLTPNDFHGWKYGKVKIRQGLPLMILGENMARLVIYDETTSVVPKKT